MEETLLKQRQYFNSGKTLDINFRIAMLKRLKEALKEWEPKLLEALRVDLGKSEFEGYESELGILYEEINHTIKHIKSWSKPKKVSTPLMHFPSKSKIISEPLGVCLIMSPWNYPLQLTIAPLIGSIAGGNCSVVKPSRYSKYTSLAIGDMLNAYFDQEYISVFQGGTAINTQLLEKKYDHIFFTGSPYVGKIVMTAAANHLTPVTLELGGKSPCIVDDTANIDIAARRIAWGKCLNSGQTCVAPDYLLVHSKVKDELITAIKKYINKFYGDDVFSNADFGKIINEKHFNRLKGLLNDGTILFGGKFNDELQKIEPTLIGDVTPQSPIMQEEVFGPLFPVMEFNTIKEVEDIIKSIDKPLALYLFTQNNQMKQHILSRISFGGGCINDTVIHLTNSEMGFGGIGASGMGSYHGKKSFETFSHQKSVLEKSPSIDIQFRYPPYENKMSLLKKLMK